MNITINKFILLICSTLLIKFAIAGCFHSKCSRNQGKDRLSTDGSTDDALSRDDEQSRLLQDDRSDAPEDIKLDCKYYKPGNLYIDRIRGIKIYLPKTTHIEQKNHTYYYSNELPTLTTSENIEYQFDKCVNTIHKRKDARGLIMYLYLLGLQIKGNQIYGSIDIYTDTDMKNTFFYNSGGPRGSKCLDKSM